MKKGQGNVNAAKRKACRTGSKVKVATCYDLDANGKRIIPEEEQVVTISKSAIMIVVAGEKGMSVSQSREHAPIVVKKGTLIVV